MKEKLIRFMQGRNGADTLSKVLLVAGLVAVFLSALMTGRFAGLLFYLPGWGMIISCHFRVFSRDVSNRYA